MSPCMINSDSDLEATIYSIVTSDQIQIPAQRAILVGYLQVG